MQGSARKDVVFGAARVYTVTVPGPKWKSWLEPLNRKIEQGPLKLDEALSIAQQVAQVIEAAHEKGIHHRNIKPENLMVDFRGFVRTQI